MNGNFEKQLENYLVNSFNVVNKKLDIINNNILKKSSSGNNNKYKSQISLTPRQIYMCIKAGWTLQELSELSGYGEEDIRKKYNNYVDNNV